MTAPTAVRGRSGHDVLFCVVAGLLLALVASGVAAVFMASSGSTYAAHVVLALVPAPNQSPADASTAATILATDQPATTAAAVLKAPSMVKAAAAAARVDPAAIAVTTTPITGSGALSFDLTAPTGDTAEAAAQALIAAATPQIQSVSGPFTVEVVSPPTDGVTQVSPISAVVLIVVGVAALVVGGAAALAARTIMSRETAMTRRSRR